MAGRIDVDNPPPVPPPGCANHLLWHTSRRLHVEHRPGPDGWCVACRPRHFFPCPVRELALLGLRASCLRQAGPSRWAPATPSRGNQRWWST